MTAPTDRRFIVVSPGSGVLYDTVSVPADTADWLVERALCMAVTQYVHREDAPTYLDRTVYLSDCDRDLCVLEVPTEIPPFSPTSVYSHSLEEGGLLEGWKEYNFLGRLVPRVQLSATIAGTTYTGESQDPDAYQRYDLALADLMSELPRDAEIGDVATIEDEDGETVRIATRRESGWDWREPVGPDDTF